MIAQQIQQAQNARAKRLAELTEEITSLHGRIRRSCSDEAQLERIGPESPEREAEIAVLRDERSRLEVALFNHLKEFAELS